MGTTYKGGCRIVICIHCGACCYDFPVVIIQNKFKDLKVEDANDLPQEAFVIKSGNTPCPYLKWDEDKSRCEVHNKPWYPSTPCFDFGQVESDSNTICRLGEYIRKKWKEGDIRFNYRFKCETFVEPSTPQELIDGPIFKREDKRRTGS